MGCAGAIDGILIWINRPTLEESRKVGVDQQKFYCGRKHKFGLNCQAVCDVRGRFLDISITYGGASSDLLAFENSKLYKLLEKGILAHGLVFFGENANLNSLFMALPFQTQMVAQNIITTFIICSCVLGLSVISECCFRDRASYV